MVKAILFDLGDTVIANDWKARNAAVKTETGVDIIRTPEIKALNDEIVLGNNVMKDLFIKIIETSNLTIDPKEVVDSYTRNYEKYCPVNGSMITLVDNMRKKVKVYALSNTNDIHKSVNIKRGIYNHFDGAFLSCDMKMKKPDPAIFQFVLKEIQCPPSEVLLIDDNEDNIASAKNVGLQTIRYTDYEDLVLKLKEYNLL